MRAVLEFSLPDDQAEFDAALHGRAAISALHDIDDQCRAALKHGSPSLAERRLLEQIRDSIPGELLDV